LILKIEMPDIQGEDRTFEKINKFYGKRLNKIVFYYSREVSKKLKEKNLISEGFPKTVEYTYEVKEKSENYLSILWCIRAHNGYLEKTVYRSENWDIKNMMPYFVAERAVSRFKLKRQIAEKAKEKCDLSKNKLTILADPDNFYIEDGKINFFMQPDGNDILIISGLQL